MKFSVNDGFPYYIEHLGHRNYLQMYSSMEHMQLFHSLTDDEANYQYAPAKWNIKQIIGHITDHERIMMYRALRLSRKDKTPLPGYDQNLYVANSKFDQQPLTQLISDFTNVRNASLSFIQSLSPDQLVLSGTVSNYELTVEDLLKATIGHELHHVEIIKNRYLAT